MEQQVEMFSPEEKKSREQVYEEWLAEIQSKQSCSRGKAKRIVDAMQRKVVKQFRANHFKSTMAKQKRRDLGIPEPAPLQLADEGLIELLDEVTEENLHDEVLTGEPVGNELI
jgi:hypothetical protein